MESADDGSASGEANIEALRGWRRNLYVIAGAQFLTVVGFSCITSFIPFYIQE